MDQDLQEICRGLVLVIWGRKSSNSRFTRFGRMLECHKCLYFCLIRGLHGILIGVVCSPNYSWFSSACPPSQTCQMCVLKIKLLAFFFFFYFSLSRVCSSGPTRYPHMQMFANHPKAKSSSTVRQLCLKCKFLKSDW